MTSAPVDRWEMGSLFHTVAVPGGAPGSGAPWEERPHALVGSGRDALRLLLDERRPERVWVPSYLCQEVVGAVATASAEVLAYPDSPLDDARVPDAWAGVRPGDAILTVAYFGVRRPRVVPAELPGGHARDQILVVEDHTHGPAGAWARTSDADFCVASLRKLWPLPDGGILWSPSSRPVPGAPPCLPELERASGIKLAGMELKARYLRGEAVAKPLFRRLLEKGESTLYSAETSGITGWSRALLEALPLAELEEARRRRFRRLVDGLEERPGVRVLGASADEGDGSEDPAPFSALVVFDDVEARDRVHRALVEARVYASRLWPLDEPVVSGVRDADVALSRRSFSVPVDMRYDEDDMDRAARILNEALGRTL